MGEGIAELRNLVAITKEVITFITRERPCYETMQRGLEETIEEKVVEKTTADTVADGISSVAWFISFLGVVLNAVCPKWAELRAFMALYDLGIVFQI